jgi:hypothetical protein
LAFHLVCLGSVFLGKPGSLKWFQVGVDVHDLGLGPQLLLDPLGNLVSVDERDLWSIFRCSETLSPSGWS